MEETTAPVIPYGTVWRTLPSSAKDVYLAMEYQYHKGDQLPFPFTFTHAQLQLGLPPSTFSRAIRELQNRGFIVKIKQGTYPGRKVTVWALSEAYLTYGLDGWEMRRVRTPQQKAEFKNALFTNYLRRMKQFQIATENDSDQEYRRQLNKILRIDPD